MELVTCTLNNENEGERDIASKGGGSGRRRRPLPLRTPPPLQCAVNFKNTICRAARNGSDYLMTTKVQSDYFIDHPRGGGDYFMTTKGDIHYQ